MSLSSFPTDPSAALVADASVIINLNATHCAAEIIAAFSSRMYLDASRDQWHVIDIGLTSERRNAGLGFAVMQAVKRHGQASTAAGIVLHVACENQRAQRFYRRLGFREVAHEEPIYARTA